MGACEGARAIKPARKLVPFSSSEPAATAAATASCFSVCLSLARFALEVDSGGGSWLGPNDDGAPSQAGSGTPHNDSETSDSRGKATTRHGLGLSPIATPSWPLPSQACPPSPRRAPLRCLDPLAAARCSVAPIRHPPPTPPAAGDRREGGRGTDTSRHRFAGR